jgi:hypothetical protein
VRLKFTLSLSDPRTTSNGHRRLPSIEGHTFDISTTGLALIVPAIRIGEHYLAGDDRNLYLSLALPDGPVELKVLPVRYESLGEDQDESGYIIGAKVSDMSPPDRERFNAYIGSVIKAEAR